MRIPPSLPLALPLALTFSAIGCSGGPSKAIATTDTSTGGFTDHDDDGYLSDEDCDDFDSNTHPDAVEVCDGVDNDCDALIDEGTTHTWYADADEDGFGDAASPVEACSPPDGVAYVGNDCDDANPDAYPGGIEVCDDSDNDCDGQVDEDLTAVWYADGDGDGYGDPGSGREACEQPASYVLDDADCDDDASSVHPGADELCNDVDDDCDGEIDEDPVDPATWYADADGDTFGDPDRSAEACSAPDGYVPDDTDCDDDASSVHPGADELCNDVDDDCDGEIDEDPVDPATWYADADGDTFGDPDRSAEACSAPDGYVPDDTDCDDDASSVHPGADELCNDIDDDCDGEIDEDPVDPATWYADADGDTFGDPDRSAEACSAPDGYVPDDTDCDDTDPDVHPGATELEGDGVDSDCDGEDPVASDCAGVSGSGTEADPYTVSCCEELQDIADHLTSWWVLTDDIDCSATDPASADYPGSAWSPGGFLPISGAFEGDLDGSGHTISGLTIDVKGSAGLFAHLYATALVHDLNLAGVEISGTSRVGAVAAYMNTSRAAYPAIMRVSVEGTVSGTEKVGGLVGESYNGGGLYDCSADVEVTGGNYTGGLIGYTWDGPENDIERCSVSGTVDGESQTGGLLGYDKSNMIVDSWSDADVSGSSSVGGLIGYNTEGGWLRRSYFAGSVTGSSAVGGLIGTMDPYGSGYFLLEHTFGVAEVSSRTGTPYALIGSMDCTYTISLLDLAWLTGGGASACDPCGGTACTAVSDESYFYDPTNPPLDVWDFVDTWEETGALPTLR